jgi:hypothetical protein
MRVDPAKLKRIAQHVEQIEITYRRGGESVTLAYQPSDRSEDHEGDRLVEMLREQATQAGE